MSLRISEVAEAAQVNTETVRYYERRGLIDQPPRTPGGHRLYDERTVTRVCGQRLLPDPVRRHHRWGSGH